MIRIRSINRVHRHGESRVGWEFSRVPVECGLCSSLNLVFEFNKWSVPSSLMIWWAKMLAGSGARVVMSMTGLARDQSEALELQGWRLVSLLALAV